MILLLIVVVIYRYTVYQKKNRNLQYKLNVYVYIFSAAECSILTQSNIYLSLDKEWHKFILILKSFTLFASSVEKNKKFILD